jgi:transcriptional regulator with XRE-family HTH domain
MAGFRDITGVIIGRNIKFRRRQLGITDEQFSQCLGIERDVLKKYESGALRVDAKLLLSIGQILDAQPQYFFSLERLVDINLIDAPDISYEKNRALFLEQGVTLNLAFARISKSKNRKVLINIAVALADIDRLSGAKS